MFLMRSRCFDEEQMFVSSDVLTIADVVLLMIAGGVLYASAHVFVMQQ